MFYSLLLVLPAVDAFEENLLGEAWSFGRANERAVAKPGLDTYELRLSRRVRAKAHGEA
jgi:hypothetical protein